MNSQSMEILRQTFAEISNLVRHQETSPKTVGEVGRMVQELCKGGIRILDERPADNPQDDKPGECPACNSPHTLGPDCYRRNLAEDGVSGADKEGK